ncbi:MAG: MnmC family methyltransferase [Verrucomicrobiae bacterium]|nr:MnmC family methyltransferase [Verrucomicrobiae bacterium]
MVQSAAVSDFEKDYRLVRLPCGFYSVHSDRYGETNHPFVGPEAEATALYVDQVRLPGRLKPGTPMVIWDIGLGAGANILSAFRVLSGSAGHVVAVSFDQSLAPLRLTHQNPGHMAGLAHFAGAVGHVLETGYHRWQQGRLLIEWHVLETDFPDFLAGPHPAHLPRPEVIFYDAYSPGKNPEMWMGSNFAHLFNRLEGREAILVTYSRSTMVRVGLLLAGFFVGSGQGTGMKEETTLAATRLSDLERPLDHAWLLRASRSTAAEPLENRAYQRRPLRPETLARLRAHPQFVGGTEGGTLTADFAD